MVFYFIFAFLFTKWIIQQYTSHTTLYDKLNKPMFYWGNISNERIIKEYDGRIKGYDERYPLLESYNQCKSEELHLQHYYKTKHLLDKLETGKYNENDKDIQDLIDEFGQMNIHPFRLYLRRDDMDI